MATIQQREAKESEQHKRDTFHALVGERLLQTLGTPDDLLKVQVRRVWENSYRVNVFVGADISAAKVAHSYFLRADENGNIVDSSPKITRQYGRVNATVAMADGRNDSLANAGSTCSD